MTTHTTTPRPGSNLFRRFVAVCVVAAIGIAVMAGWGLYAAIDRYLVEHSGRDAVRAAQACLASVQELVLHRQADGRTVVAIEADDVESVAQKLRERLVGFEVIKIKVFDHTTTIVYSNDPLVVGKVDSDNPKLQAALDGSVVGKLVHKEDVRNMADEQRFNVDVVETYVPIRDASGRVVGALEVYQDVTESRRAQLEALFFAGGALVATVVLVFGVLIALMRAAHRRLDRSVQLQHEAAREVEALNDDLEEKVADRTAEVDGLLAQKDRFIRQLGHDLKTPLVSLNVSLPALAESAEDPELKGLIHVGIDNVAYMQTLVERMLQFMRVRGGDVALARDPVDLCERIGVVVAAFEQTAEAESITFINETDAPVWVVADEIAVREIMDNLVSNSIKYMGGPGRITLSTRSTERMVEIGVADTGVGIAPDQIERVLEEFYKVDPSRHDRSSVGLGLTICQATVAAMGGRLSIESDGLGCGTTVRWTVPRATLPDEVAPKSQAKDDRRAWS